MVSEGGRIGGGEGQKMREALSDSRTATPPHRATPRAALISKSRENCTKMPLPITTSGTSGLFLTGFLFNPLHVFIRKQSVAIGIQIFKFGVLQITEYILQVKTL